MKAPHLETFLSRLDIKKIVQALAARISKDYRDQEVVLIGVLKGGFVFLADLIRELTNPVQIDFIQAASYGSETTSTGQVEMKKKLEMDIADRHVLLVEDIVDSGLTIAYLLEYLKQLKPASVKVCAFINKVERRKIDVPIDYVGHTVEAGFLVGYGLDLNERYRDLPGLYHLKT